MIKNKEKYSNLEFEYFFYLLYKYDGRSYKKGLEVREMLCDKCGVNQATVQYVQVINGDRTELHLCKDCAAEMGIGAPNVDIPFSMPIGFSNIFDNLFDGGTRPIAELNQVNLSCPRCGTTFNDFLKNGAIGCSECYKAFEKEFSKIIKRTHGTDKYIGKKYTKKKNTEEAPKEATKPKKEDNKLETIESLTRELKECINEEKYEEAAKIRDKIAKLKEE